MVKQKKYTLNIDEDIDFEVIGISTPFADYRLAWELNDKFEFKFEKSPDLISIYNRKSKDTSKFHQFSFIDEENFKEFYLVKNKQGNQFVTQDHALMDFILIFKSNLMFDSKEFISRLRNTNGIIAAFKLDVSNFDFLDFMN